MQGGEDREEPHPCPRRPLTGHLDGVSGRKQTFAGGGWGIRQDIWCKGMAYTPDEGKARAGSEEGLKKFVVDLASWVLTV